MRRIWQSLYADLFTSTGTLNAAKHFEAAKRERPELRRFTDLAAVLDFLHARDGDPETKDRILAAFVGITQSSGSGAEFAMTVLWLALWPALDAVYRRLSRHFRDAPEDLVSEMTEQFTIAVRRADMGRIQRAAATLVRNAERNVRARLRRTWRERRRLVPSCDEQGPADRDEIEGRIGNGASGLLRLGLPMGIGFDQEVHLIREELLRLVGNRADLVVAVVVLGEPPERDRSAPRHQRSGRAQTRSADAEAAARGVRLRMKGPRCCPDPARDRAFSCQRRKRRGVVTKHLKRTAPRIALRALNTRMGCRKMVE